MAVLARSGLFNGRWCELQTARDSEQTRQRPGLQQGPSHRDARIRRQGGRKYLRHRSQVCIMYAIHFPQIHTQLKCLTFYHTLWRNNHHGL